MKTFEDRIYGELERLEINPATDFYKLSYDDVIQCMNEQISEENFKKFTDSQLVAIMQEAVKGVGNSLDWFETTVENIEDSVTYNQVMSNELEFIEDTEAIDYFFDVSKFIETLKGSSFTVHSINTEQSTDSTYISFNEDRLFYIRVPKRYRGENNCINIYHGESSKNGYWWNGELIYANLILEMLKYKDYQ